MEWEQAARSHARDLSVTPAQRWTSHKHTETEMTMFFCLRYLKSFYSRS